MAEQWENAQLNYEIEACNEKIRKLSDSLHENHSPSSFKNLNSYSNSNIKYTFSDYKLDDDTTHPDKFKILKRLKKISNMSDKNLTQDDLLNIIQDASPWACIHPFFELIYDCKQRIRIRQELQYGRKLLEDALLSENVEEIIRCLQQVFHMKSFGLEKEIKLCKQTLKKIHISELKQLLCQFCSSPDSVPDIHQLLDQAMLYKDILYKEILTVQDQLQIERPHYCSECGCAISNCRNSC